MIGTWEQYIKSTGLSNLQFGGGSTVISASSFWILLAEVERALPPLAPAAAFFPPGVVAPAEAGDDVLDEDIGGSRSFHKLKYVKMTLVSFNH